LIGEYQSGERRQLLSSAEAGKKGLVSRRKENTFRHRVGSTYFPEKKKLSSQEEKGKAHCSDSGERGLRDRDFWGKKRREKTGDARQTEGKKKKKTTRRMRKRSILEGRGRKSLSFLFSRRKKKKRKGDVGEQSEPGPKEKPSPSLFFQEKLWLTERGKKKEAGRGQEPR